MWIVSIIHVIVINLLLLASLMIICCSIFSALSHIFLWSCIFFRDWHFQFYQLEFLLLPLFTSIIPSIVNVIRQFLSYNIQVSSSFFFRSFLTLPYLLIFLTSSLSHVIFLAHSCSLLQNPHLKCVYPSFILIAKCLLCILPNCKQSTLPTIF